MCGCEGGLMPVIIYVVGFFVTWFILSVLHQLDKRDWEKGGDSFASWAMICCWPFTLIAVKGIGLYKVLNFFMYHLSRGTARVIQSFER